MELARALYRRPRILILDEPTAVLGRDDAQRLLALVRELRADGVAVLYVSHNLDEVLEVADRITVVGDGQVAARLDAGSGSEPLLVRLMVGHDVALRAERAPRSVAGGEPALRAEGLRRGVVRMLCGIDRPESGTIRVGGRPLRHVPRGTLQQGVVYVAEDRRHAALLGGEDVVENVALARRGLYGGISRAHRRHVAAARELAERLQLRASALGTTVAGLSGGNQQKVVLARWLRIEADVFVLDEPTQGIDVAAKEEIHEFVHGLAEAGKAVILISSEAPDLVTLADRVVVLRRGRVAGELSGPEIEEHRIVALATSSQSSTPEFPR